MGNATHYLWRPKKPAVRDLRSLSERITKLEHILREYAKGEPRLAEILKQYALW